MRIESIEQLVAAIGKCRFVAPGIPEGWDAEECQKIAFNLAGAIGEALGTSPLVVSFTEQDRSDYARLTIPKGFLIDGDNPYVEIALSMLDHFATLLYEWDVLEKARETIKQTLESQGFVFVPYTLFATPTDNHWRYDYNWSFRNEPPPPGKGQLRHEDLWGSLFDYI
jgi:hypothetical protein